MICSARGLILGRENELRDSFKKRSLAKNYLIISSLGTVRIFEFLPAALKYPNQRELSHALQIPHALRLQSQVV